MTYKRFLEIVEKEIDLYISKDLKPLNPGEIKKQKDHSNRYQYESYSDILILDKNGELNYYLIKKWSTGGCSGGNCWNDTSPTPYSSSEKVPDFEALDKILEYFCPTISHLQYKKLTSTLIQNDSYSEYEYYGNCTDYAVEFIKLKDLWSFLENRGLIKDETI